MKFEDLKLIEPLLKAIKEKGYVTPSPIQEKSIPAILEKRDLLGCAQTGTGKTAAFAIPILQMLVNENDDGPRKIKALILTPTRELAIQIRDNFRDYGKHTDLRCSVILGGVNQKSQVEVLKKGIDILVATPGRLLDLIDQRYAKLGDVKYLVLDEADTMLDMGFIHDVKKVMAHLPEKRQTLLFSATMPKEIIALSDSFLKNPVQVIVTPVASTVDKVDQVLYYVDKSNKSKLLLDILKSKDMGSTLIFTRTKHGANKLTELLNDNHIACAAIHGNKSQSARQQALAGFKNGDIGVLVATDIAARGIDIKELSHVINYEIPNVFETYVHRIGRTARAGLGGSAISLCDFDEKPYIKGIEKLINKTLDVISDHNYPMLVTVSTPVVKQTSRSNNDRRPSTSNKQKPSLNSFSSNKPIGNNKYKPNFGKKTFNSNTSNSTRFYKQTRSK